MRVHVLANALPTNSLPEITPQLAVNGGYWIRMLIAIKTS